MKKRILVCLIAVFGLSLISARAQSNPPKDGGTFSVAQQSGTQSEWDTAYAAASAISGCKVWCVRLQTLAPVFFCDGGSLFNCDCPRGWGIFIMWREFRHIFTAVRCTEFYEGISFNFNNYYNSCYTYPGYSDWNYEACGDGYHWSCTSNGCIQNSPIVIDVDGDGFDMTGPASGVLFNFSRDGLDRMGWIAQGSDDAFLVLDRNNNGLIEDGFELFGNLTSQPASAEPNGFLALAQYDNVENGGNGDSVIDRRDAVFTRLRLWQDNNHNAISEGPELQTLEGRGITKIELSYHESRKVDQYGNQFKYRAKVWGKGGSQGRWAWDVFFQGGPDVLNGTAAVQREDNFDFISTVLGWQDPVRVCGQLK